MCGPHFCSMKITEGVQKYAAEQELSEQEAFKLVQDKKRVSLTKQVRRFTRRCDELKRIGMRRRRLAR